MSLEQAYQRAVEDPSQRQAFLDQIVEERGLPNHVLGLIYQKEQVFAKISPSIERKARMGTPFPDLMEAIRRSSMISIFPAAFDGEFIGCLDDFLSSLEDHEYKHIDQKYNHFFHWRIMGFLFDMRYFIYDMGHNLPVGYAREKLSHLSSRISWKLYGFSDGVEIEAYRNQIAGFRSRSCSDKFKRDIGTRLYIHLPLANKLEIESETSH